MHIGLIGGIGPAATGFYYRGLIRSHPPQAAPLELTIVHADQQSLRRNLADDLRADQARIFCTHINQLAAAGAEVAAVTAIAGHFCYEELAAISPLPLVSALDTLADEIEHRGFHRVGLLGAHVAMETELYGSLADFEVLVPAVEDLAGVGEAYFAMADAQQVDARQRDLFFRVGSELCRDQQADVVVLAGTDLFLAFAGQDADFPVIDSAEVHIKALSHLASQPASG